MIKKNIIYFIAIVFIAFLSYQYNFFHVTSTKWFNEHQIDSEQLVLDGILHTQDITEFKLGRYSRPKMKIEENSLQARELFVSQNVDGTFEAYNSQYGIQGRLFLLLYSLGFGEVSSLQLIPSLLMSILVAVLFFLVQRDFSTKPAIVFISVLIFSPWVVVFARNLYWFEALWFAPFVVSMYFSNKIFTSKKNYLVMIAIFYFLFLVRFLSGYEYITSIVIATFLPIIYQGLVKKLPKSKILKYLIPIGMISILSFSTAVVIHSKSISNNGDGLNYIYLVAKKRLFTTSSKDASIIADKTCNGSEVCSESIAGSLRTSHLSVVSKYFFLFTDFVPWLGVTTDNELTREQREHIIRISINPENNYFKRFIVLAKYTMSLDLNIATIINIFYNRPVSPLIFMLLILFYIKSFKSLSNDEKIFTVLLFLPPVSWFFLAKGHSHIHRHMNYILWFLPTLPYLIAILYSSYMKKDVSNTKT